MSTYQMTLLEKLLSRIIRTMHLVGIMERRKRKITYGIAVAMAHVHSKHVMHCNLSPENVLLDKNHNPIIKYFRLAKFIESSAQENPIRSPFFIDLENIEKNLLIMVQKLI